MGRRSYFGRPPSSLDVDTPATFGKGDVGHGGLQSIGLSGRQRASEYKTTTANDWSSSVATVVGLATADYAAGATGFVRLVGRMTKLSGLVVGAVYLRGRHAGHDDEHQARHNVLQIGIPDSTSSICSRLWSRVSSRRGRRRAGSRLSWGTARWEHDDYGDADRLSPVHAGESHRDEATSLQALTAEARPWARRRWGNLTVNGTLSRASGRQGLSMLREKLTAGSLVVTGLVTAGSATVTGLMTAGSATVTGLRQISGCRAADARLRGEMADRGGGTTTTIDVSLGNHIILTLGTNISTFSVSASRVATDHWLRGSHRPTHSA